MYPEPGCTWELDLRRYPETYQHRCRTEAGKCKGTPGMGNFGRSETCFPAWLVQPFKIMNPATEKVGLVEQNHPKMSGMWRLKLFWWSQADWLHSGLACFQDNKDWKSQPKSGVPESWDGPTGDFTHTHDLSVWIEETLPEIWMKSLHLLTLMMTFRGNESCIRWPNCLAKHIISRKVASAGPWGLRTCPSWSIFDYSRKVLKAASWVVKLPQRGLFHKRSFKKV